MGRTIPICSALALLAFSPTAEARSVASPLQAYARARTAPDAAIAARNFEDVLTELPDDGGIAWRAWRQGIAAGNFSLALRAAHTLDRIGVVPSEARILLYLEAVRERNWADAERKLQLIAREPSLGFVAPILGDWLALATRDPVVLPQRTRGEGANVYAAESRALLALARGEVQDGSDAVKTLWVLDPYRSQSLRLAAASTLADRKVRAPALALLVADTGSTKAARGRIAAHRKLGLSVDDPARGAAFVLARMSGDLITEGAGSPALTLARLAQYADSGNPRIRLLVAGALSAAHREGQALTLAQTLTRDPLYGDDAESFAIDMLEALDRHDEALALAEKRGGRSPNDASRVGEIELKRGDAVAAARRFDVAVATAGSDAGWPLLQASGNAHLQAGDWAAARGVLERAYALAPDEPLVLNSLGLALAENGEGTRGRILLERAAALKPEDPAIADSLGWAAYRSGAFDTAVATLERAYALDQAQPEIGEHLGDAYWSTGRRIDARYAWIAAREQAEGAARLRLDGKIDRGLP